MAEYRRASFYPPNPNTYDGNGKIHQSEKDSGVKLMPDRSGKGWRKTGNVKDGKRLATIQDDSATKILADNAELKKENEKLKKTNEDMLSLVKDMDRRLKDVESKKESK